MIRDPISLLNYVVNQPEVLPFVAPGCEYLDMEPFFNNPANVMLGDERGLVIFAALGDASYEGHYLLTRALPAAQRLPFLRACLVAMFTEHNAHAIRGKTPRDNRAARIVNRALGFLPVGSALDNTGRPCTYYVLERATWVRSLDFSPAQRPLRKAVRSRPRATKLPRIRPSKATTI